MKMKKTIFVLSVLMLIPSVVLAWDDCPYGEVNDAYPGDCGRYIDSDGDGICDHSQSVPEGGNSESPKPEEEKKAESSITKNEEEIHDLITGQELKSKTVEEVAKIYQIDPNKYAKELADYYKVTVKPTDSFQLLHDNYGIEPSVAKDIASSILTEKQVNISNTKNKNEKTYPFMSILIVLSLIYFTTLFLSKRKLISVLTHKRIWNIFLLISFLISGILGVLLIIRINFGTVIPLPFNILFWHVETGIVMFIISVFHIIERWYFFKDLIRRIMIFEK